MAATAPANRDAFVNDLAALTGLDKGVLTEWAKLENGGNNNVLGVTNNGVLAVYNTPAEGAQATATRLKTSPLYANVIASTSSSPAAQANAIARSPWRLGSGGLKAAGGIDPYYLRGFNAAGILSGSPIVGGTGGSGGGMTDVKGPTLASAFPALPPSTPFSDQLFQMLAGDLNTSNPDNASILAGYQKYLGHPINTIPLDPRQTSGGSLLSFTGGIPAGLLTGVSAPFIFIGVIIVAVAFVLLGGLVILKGPKSAS